MRVVADTSAVLSLAAGDILVMALQSLDIIIPPRVEQELAGLSQNHDFVGNLAREVRSYIGKEIVVIEPSLRAERGEIECAYLANGLHDVEFMITDDTQALEKLEKICTKKVRFSTIIVFALYLRGKITKEQGRRILERMRVKRDWKDNLIFEQAEQLWDSLG